MKTKECAYFWCNNTFEEKVVGASAKKFCSLRCKKRHHDRNNRFKNSPPKARVQYAEISGEIWKDIKEYKGYYQVSDYGRVRVHPETKSPTHQGKGSSYPGKILKPLSCHNKKEKKEKGYRYFQAPPIPSLGLSQRKKLRIHRLVAEAFILNPAKKPEINHMDGDKSNNRVSNLEWCTGEENREHARQAGLA